MVDRASATASVGQEREAGAQTPKQAALVVLATGAWTLAAMPAALEPALSVCLLHEQSAAQTVGRGADAQLQLDDALSSRLHCTIHAIAPGHARLTDNNSRHGTWVNGVRVREAELQSGDLVRAGSTLLMYVDDWEAYAPFEWPQAPRTIVGGLWPRRLHAFAQRFGAADLPVLLRGPTGAGKEVAANLVHHASKRVGPFHAVNCAAIPAELAEAELFGYRKGAFTGAQQARIGHLELAQGGTLLLDEIADLPLALQAKLLRVVENRQFAPIGESKPQPLDVRFMAATCLPLEEYVEQGRFRADLYHRICGVKLLVPALAERVEDVPALLRHALQSAASTHACTLHISAAELEYAIRRPYVGNVRELQHVCERAVLTGRTHAGQVITTFERTHVAATTPQRRAATAKAAPSMAAPAPPSAPEPELSTVLAALESCAGNVAHAAAALSVHRAQIYRVLRQHNIRASAYRA